MASVCASGGVHFFVTSSRRFLTKIVCEDLSSTANRLRATKTALLPDPRRESEVTSPRALAESLGKTCSSYDPPSESKLIKTAFSAGLYDRLRGPAADAAPPARRMEMSGLSRWLW